MKFRLLLIVLLLLNFCKVNAQSLDLRILDHINGPVSGADGTWRFITNTANYVDVAAPVTMLAVGFADHNQDLKIKGYTTLTALAFTAGETLILKDIVKRPRPYVTYPDQIVLKTGIQGDYSFPSGHTSLAFSTATSLSLSFPKWYVIAPSFLYAGAVGYSRMYLGVHYPSDVLAGAVLGAGTSYLTFKAQKWLSKKRK